MPTKYHVFALVLLAFLQGFPSADAGEKNSAGSSTSPTSGSTVASDPHSGPSNSYGLSSVFLACYPVRPCFSTDAAACFADDTFNRSSPGCDYFLNFCGCLGSDDEFDYTRDGCNPMFMICTTAYNSEPVVGSADGNVTVSDAFNKSKQVASPI